MKQLILLIAVAFMTGSCTVTGVMSETLISSSKNINVGNYEINGAGWSVKKYTLHGGKSEGVEIIEVDNGKIVITIIPTRGMNVMSVKSKDITLGWDSPVKEIVHPAFVDLNYNGGLGWLDSFNEWMMRCGIEYSGHPGDDNGRLMTLHGRIAHIPASEVTVSVDTDNRIHVKGVVRENAFKKGNFKLETDISTVVGSNSLRFDDKVTNTASHEQEFQILYHANYAKELLEANSKLLGTIKSVQPFNDFAKKTMKTFDVYDAPGSVDPGGEKVYQIIPFGDQDGNAHFMLHNAAADKAVSFKYGVETLPYFSQWKNEDSMENGYVTGLEPGNSFPANRSHERKKGRIPKIKGGETKSYMLEYTLHSGKEDVSAGVKVINDLNKGKKIEFNQTPEH